MELLHLIKAGKLVAVITVFAALTACGSQSVKPQDQPTARQDSRAGQDRALQALLQKADAATNADRLQQPLNDNAVDRLRAARLLSPNNPAIDQGYAKVITRYMQLSQQQLTANRPGKAKYFFEQASVLVKEVTSQEVTLTLGSHLAALDERLASYKVPVVEPDKPEPLEDNTIESYPLDAQQLSQRSELLVASLGALAQRLRFSGETMMIVAKTDADARWVYKQMRKAVPGYRLRGDIKTGREPRIEIMPPI